MASRILTACDGVKDLLVAELDLAEPDEIQRAYVPVIDRADFEGMRFWVYPAAYRDAERQARRRVKKELRVAVEFERKYGDPATPDPAGRVPVEWVDLQVEYVETTVFDLLNDTGVREGDLVAGRFRTESCEVTTVVDPGRLHADKVFASLIEVVYSETAEG